MAKRKESFDPGLHHDAGPAVLDRDESDRTGGASIYAPEYSGRHWWILGIRIDEERNQIPFHNSAFGGIPWQQGTQREVQVQEGWMGLEIHRLRLTHQIMYAHQAKRAVAEIKQKVVRWQPRKRDEHDSVKRWKADIISLEHRIKSRDPETRKFIPSGYRYQPGPNDEPLSKYLVFIPRSELQKMSGGVFYEPDLKKIPTMLELDPSLIPDRMAGRAVDIEAGDEAW